MDNLYIRKNLDWEDQITDSITYIALAGVSEVSNFRSPDSYVFIFFEKCRGVHCIDFIKYDDADNQVHISFPGQIHSWKTEFAIGHKLIISKKFMEMNLFDTGFSSQYINSEPVINLTADQSARLYEEFNLLKREIEQIVPQKIISLRTQIIISLISVMVHENSFNGIVKTKIHPIVSTFYSLIEENFLVSKSVGFYANKLAVTANYLNILVKADCGQTAKDIIDARIVLEAKRMLLGSNLSIKQISFDLGFPTISFFSAYIYKKTGFYPKKFREDGIHL